MLYKSLNYFKNVIFKFFNFIINQLNSGVYYIRIIK